MLNRNVRRFIYPLLLIRVLTNAIPVGPVASNSIIATSTDNVQADDSQVTSPIETLDTATPTTPTATTPTTLVAITSTTPTAIGNITLQDGSPNINITNDDADSEEPPSQGQLPEGEISIQKGGGAAGGRGSSSPSSGGGGGGVDNGNPVWFPLGGGIFGWPWSLQSAACAVDGAAIAMRAMALASVTALAVLCVL
ncbi:hypothetical protein F5B17DRAFT_431665 [Nemania serpens]|nr:hypothetical protein F5B17DRAFT_431665 [Nemania serpens]